MRLRPFWLPERLNSVRDKAGRLPADLAADPALRALLR